MPFDLIYHYLEDIVCPCAIVPNDSRLLFFFFSMGHILIRLFAYLESIFHYSFLDLGAAKQLPLNHPAGRIRIVHFGNGPD